jgi:hypothetical protein
MKTLKNNFSSPCKVWYVSFECSKNSEYSGG